MSNAVNTLEQWFYRLSEHEKIEVIDFLYGQLALSENHYYGPDPNVIQKGLHFGPKPYDTQSTQVCPTCNRPI